MAIKQDLLFTGAGVGFVVFQMQECLASFRLLITQLKSPFSLLMQPWPPGSRVTMSSEWKLSGMGKDALLATSQALEGTFPDPVLLGHRVEYRVTSLHL